MDFLLLGKSIALGLAVAAPLGPIGTLCIHRTLKKGFRAGLAGGLGTALGDAFFAAIAALGFSALASAIADYQLPLKLIGGFFMLWLGWRGLGADPHAHSLEPAAGKRAMAKDLSGVVAVTFLLTVTNPLTVFFFAAVFAGFGSIGGSDVMVVVGGIFCGSLLWWLILCGGVTMARHRLPRHLIQRISQGAGLMLILVGGWIFGSAVWELARPGVVWGR